MDGGIERTSFVTMSSDSDDKKGDSSPQPWQGWVDYTIEAPSSGPLPADWPPVSEVRALLVEAGRRWDAAGRQPPSVDGLLLPPGYVKEDENADDALERMVADWRRNLREGLKIRNQPDMYPSAEGDLQQFLDTGKSGVNPLPLKLQCLLLAKNRVFGAHAHPTIELEYTLRGALGEVRLVPQSVQLCLPVGYRGPWMVRPDDCSCMKGPNLSKLEGTYKDLPQVAEWKEMEPVKPDTYLFNEVGVIHKSYTTEEDGAFLVLWGTIHATILPEEEGTDIKGSELLALSHVTEKARA